MSSLININGMPKKTECIYLAITAGVVYRQQLLNVILFIKFFALHCCLYS